MIEHCYMQFDPNYPNHPNVDELIAQIHAVGPAAVVLSSDSGKSGFPQLAGCLTNFRAMLADEFSPQDLRTMFAVNPAWLMGLAI
jgi:hypothetical protein